MTRFIILKRSQVDGMTYTEHATLRVREGRGVVAWGNTVNGRRSDLFKERGPQRVSYADAMEDARQLFRDRMLAAGHDDATITAWLDAVEA